jgi:hypothetical protein
LTLESKAALAVCRLHLWSTERATCPKTGHEGAGAVLREGLLIVYCGAIGFVAAGIAASFYKMVTSEAARFALLGQGWLAAVSTFLFFAVTGPAIIMEMALKRRTKEDNAGGWLVASLVVAGLWSVCSGILVLGLVLSLESGLA